MGQNISSVSSPTLFNIGAFPETLPVQSLKTLPKVLEFHSGKGEDLSLLVLNTNRFELDGNDQCVSQKDEWEAFCPNLLLEDIRFCLNV